MTIISRALQVISKVLPQIDPVQYETVTERRLTAALCTLSIGAERCDIQKTAVSHLFLRLFKAMAPTPHSSDDNAIGFSWWGQEYKMTCGAGICSMQREVRVEKSEWAQFLEGGLFLGCTPAPEEKKLEDVVSFIDGSNQDSGINETASVVKTTFCSSPKESAVGHENCFTGEIKNIAACVDLLNVYTDKAKFYGVKFDDLMKILTEKPAPDRITLTLSGDGILPMGMFNEFLEFRKGGVRKFV